MGGLGLRQCTSAAVAAYTASRLACADRLTAWFPIFAGRDPATDPHPWFAMVQESYEELRGLLRRVHTRHARMDADVYYYADGLTVVQAFHPSKLPKLESSSSPSHPCTRSWISAAVPIFAPLQQRGNCYDPFCDRLLGENGTDRSAPHTAVLRVLYAMHQVTAQGAVVYGDKEHKD